MTSKTVGSMHVGSIPKHSFLASTDLGCSDVLCFKDFQLSFASNLHGFCSASRLGAPVCNLAVCLCLLPNQCWPACQMLLGGSVGAWLLQTWCLAAGNDMVQVGIATFDTTVHFYSLQASQSQAQMLVMPDVEDVYSVSSASVVVPLQPSLDLVISCFSASGESSKLDITSSHTHVAATLVSTAVKHACEPFVAWQTPNFHNIMLLILPACAYPLLISYSDLCTL